MDVPIDDGHFGRQRVHLVAEQRTLVGIGVEVQVARRRAQFVLGFLEQLVAVGGERIVAPATPCE